ncbi:MAG TPA: phosphopentomutase [Ktedonobacter sp.]|jgi:phosphopentomutase|nr:phosphopentomutase [Ktedonobacter sp.]HAT45488.1 phosphopentomutase [Ktedonobacter sp.]HBE25187.1 phosphopentomutase [Ktedonobacter sp.]HCF85582.1 phosphopentomutase [Ktedonobacter sp.]HCJ34404.1 phosphopentomutase [Ktedonobacter sp.]
MTTLKRAILVVLDGVGAGANPDAHDYGDDGASSLEHCAQAIGGLALPCLGSIGLGNITPIMGTPPTDQARGSYGRMAEAAAGKDSTTGHWEMTGVVLQKPLPTYPHGFPPDIVAAFEQAIGRKVIGNKAASGTEIIKELGEEHVRTSFPILYTSADSVFQLAAHQEVIPLPELYHMCEIARHMLTGDHAVGRVIARPFIGTSGAFKRTEHRRDFSLQPLGTTLLDLLKADGKDVIGLGKIEDLFAGRGLTQSDHTETNSDGMKATLSWLDHDFNGLLFVNLVEFDMLWGHRRDSEGYARALRDIDAWFARVQQAMKPEDAIFFTADHGVDPTYRGTDHTREYVPLLAYGDYIRANVDLGTRSTFADLGQTLAQAFGVGQLAAGTSFARELGLV